VTSLFRGCVIVVGEESLSLGGKRSVDNDDFRLDRKCETPTCNESAVPSSLLMENYKDVVGLRHKSCSCLV
jgi:hypothetical protein